MIEWLHTQLGFSVLMMVIIINVLMGGAAYCIFFERKVAAYVQDRWGPNRVGPHGWFQSFADGIKMLLKEDVIPGCVDKPLFVLAPMIAFIVAMVLFAVIPWAGPIVFADGHRVEAQVASVNIGVLYILAVGSLGVYGVVLGGWASNNKYSFYGGMRAAAQMLSYEIPLGLSILVIVLTTGELRLEKILTQQVGPDGGGVWNVLLHPLACVLLFTTALAEANRAPFDLAEAEQELVGGYHTEYSALKFGLYFLGEYAHMLTASAFMTVLFFGGWELFPFSWKLGWAWVDWINQSTHWTAAVVRGGIVMGKVSLFIFLYMWVRWTLPRFRFDQLMTLAWKGLIPVASLLVLLAAVLVYFNRPVSWWAPVGDFAVILVVVIWTSFSRSPLTGRQANLPPIPTGPALARGGRR